RPRRPWLPWMRTPRTDVMGWPGKPVQSRTCRAGRNALSWAVLLVSGRSMRCGRAGVPAAWLVGGISQVLAKPVAPPLDECPTLGDPALGRPQGLGVKAAGSGAAELP